MTDLIIKQLTVKYFNCQRTKEFCMTSGLVRLMTFYGYWTYNREVSLWNLQQCSPTNYINFLSKRSFKKQRNVNSTLISNSVYSVNFCTILYYFVEK